MNHDFLPALTTPPTMSALSRAPVLALAAIAVMLGACSSGSQEAPTVIASAPHSSAPETPSPVTPTASPTGTPTADALSTADEAAAEQFVRNWFAAFDDAFAQKNPELLKPYYRATCVVCAQTFDEVAQNRTKGYVVEGARSSITFIRAQIAPGPTQSTVTAAVRAEPGKLLDASHKVIDVYEGIERTDYVFHLVRDGSSFTIQNVDILDAE